IAAIASREIGHSMGVNYDGLAADPGYDPENPDEGLRGPEDFYYPAAPNAAGLQPAEFPEWAPIMADARNAKLTQWDPGTYARARYDEDDLEILTTVPGFGYRADDAGS
ncbi:unnamed protein product, partial [Ectocarpus sp. 4 AP-2014]